VKREHVPCCLSLVGGRASSGPFTFLQSLLHGVLNRKCTEVREKCRCLQTIWFSALASPCPLGISLWSVPLWWENASLALLEEAELVSPDHQWPFLKGWETLFLGTATLSSPLCMDSWHAYKPLLFYGVIFNLSSNLY